MVKMGLPGAVTVKVADAPGPVPLLVELTWPVVFTLAPMVTLVIFTVMTQLVPCPPVAPPVSDSWVSPAALPGETVPPQVLLNPGVVAIDMPAGNGSTTARPASDSGLPAGLEIVKVITEVPPAAMLMGRKALAMTGE